MSKRSLIAFLLATTLSGTLVTPSFANGIDYFFNHTAVNTSQKPLLSPFPGFAAASSDSKPKTRPPAPIQHPTQTPTPTPTPKTISENAPPKQQALVWFENFDDIIYTMGPSDHESYILKRPISKEAERLHEWIDASNSMARKYRLIAKRIRVMRPSHSIADLKEFQTEAADWYDDSAQLAEELTATRAPARTYEELERAYQDFMMRSKNLASVATAVTALNTKLREQYDVHQPKYTDESAKYIDSVAHQIKEK
jgi:hypothetical protein